MLGEDDGEEQIDVGDMRVGVGHCWMSEERTCTEACMSFDLSADSGQSPCILLQTMQAVADPLLEQRDLIVQVLQLLGAKNNE